MKINFKETVKNLKNMKVRIISTLVLAVGLTGVVTYAQVGGGLYKAKETKSVELDTYASNPIIENHEIKLSQLTNPTETQSWTVPAGEGGWYLVHLVGGEGGDKGTHKGAKGRDNFFDLKLNEGDVLYYTLGAKGAEGAQGGSSHLYLNGTAEANRIMTAPGGAGATDSADGYFETIGGSVDANVGPASKWHTDHANALIREMHTMHKNSAQRKEEAGVYFRRLPKVRVHYDKFYTVASFDKLQHYDTANQQFIEGEFKEVTSLSLYDIGASEIDVTYRPHMQSSVSDAGRINLMSYDITMDKNTLFNLDPKVTGHATDYASLGTVAGENFNESYHCTSINTIIPRTSTDENIAYDIRTQDLRDIDMYFVYIAPSYYVQCQDLNSSYLAATSVSYGDKFADSNYDVSNPIFKDLKADGLQFLGWWTATMKEEDGIEVVDEYVKQYTINDTMDVYDNLYLYAKWGTNSYKLTFDPQGGTLQGSSSITVNYSSSVGNLPKASKTGKEFLGWCTKADGTGAYLYDNQLNFFSTDTTLYAVYEDLVTNNGSKTFQYSGRRETYVIPHDGYYRLECYGGSGESSGQASGGLGGYVQAVKKFNKGDVVYVNVGATGASSRYNGGGKGGKTSNNGGTVRGGALATGGNGGGASDIRFGGSGSSNRILVAGGGGGAQLNLSGGSAGPSHNNSFTNRDENTKAIDGYGENTSNYSGTVPGTESQKGDTIYQKEGGGGGGGYNGGVAGKLARHYHGAVGASNSCYKRVYCDGSVICYHVMWGVNGDPSGPSGEKKGHSGGGCTSDHKNYSGEGHVWHDCNAECNKRDIIPIPTGHSRRGIDAGTEDHGAYTLGKNLGTCGAAYNKLDCDHQDLGNGDVVKSGQCWSASQGGSNYVQRGLLYTKNVSGTRNGDGKVIITPLYEFYLDLNPPTNDGTDAVGNTVLNNSYWKATNVPSLILKGQLYGPNKPGNPLDKDGGTDKTNSPYRILVALNELWTNTEGITETPTPTLKGWTFEGWSFRQDYHAEDENEVHECITKGGIVDFAEAVSNLDVQGKPALGNTLYAHWQENTYYIQYVCGDTTKNVYNDTCTEVSSFGTGLTESGYTAITPTDTSFTVKDTSAKPDKIPVLSRDTAKMCITQKCLYDHNVTIQQNRFLKTGYIFNGWTNKIDSSNLTGSKNVGTGTGKRVTGGTLYHEYELLTPDKDGEKFKTGKSNFDYVTDAKKHSSDLCVPKWSYTQSGVSDGSNTIIMYAIWEPIRYEVQFMGNDTSHEVDGNKYVDTWNKVPPYKQKVTGADGVKTTLIRYDQIFTLDANRFSRPDEYDAEINGMEVPIHVGYDHVGWLFGKNTMRYAQSPTWNLLEMNTETDPNQGLEQRNYTNQQANVRNVLSKESVKRIKMYNLDWIKSRTKSGDTAIYNKEPYLNKSFQQDLHSIWQKRSGKDPDDPDPTHTKISLKFDLNGGQYLYMDNNEVVVYDTDIILKQELFNEFSYNFNIIGTENVDLLHNSLTLNSSSKLKNRQTTLDCYGYDTLNDYLNNFEHENGINYTITRIDDNGQTYRFLGWSLDKEAKVPDVNTSTEPKHIDGYPVNLDVYSAEHSKEIKIANDTTLYAVWEPVLQSSVEMKRTLGDLKFKDGTLPLSKAESLTAATTAAGSNPTLQLIIKSGEQAGYRASIRGKEERTFKINFDPTIIDIYNNGSKNSLWYDELNIVNSENIDELQDNSQKQSLNRLVKFAPNLLDRKFHIPKYLGTENSYITSIGKTQYDAAIEIKQPSYFWYTFKGGKDEVINLDADIYLVLDNNVTPPGPGPDPDPDPDPPTPGDPPITVRETKTDILN